MQLFPATAVSSYCDIGSVLLATDLQLTLQVTLFPRCSSQFFGALDSSRIWTAICSGLETREQMPDNFSFVHLEIPPNVPFDFCLEQSITETKGQESGHLFSFIFKFSLASQDHTVVVDISMK